MFKLAAIIGGVLLMAGVALAGTMTSLDSTNSPTVGTTPSPATFTVRHDDRGQVTEQRGRVNEPVEDLRGPCDEPEHANDARCTGAPAADDHRGDRNRGPGRDDRSGPGSGHEDSSGHEDGHDD